MQAGEQYSQAYCSRRQYVVVNGVCSPITPVMSGVPQGSILGPLLFITYINPVSNLSLSSEAKLTIYADDILLYKPIFYGDGFSALQQDIDQISNCIRLLHLSMNPSKCKYLIASKKRCALNPPTQLLLDGKVLEEVSSYRYLGIVVTPSLSWKSHINQICNKTRKLIGLLFRKYSNWADTNTLKNIYVTCIRPHLEYACQLWDPYTSESINILEGVQKFAC